MNNPKQYINGIFVREHKWNEVDTSMKISIPEDKLTDLFKQLKLCAKNGWISLIASKLRENKVNTAGKVIATHYVAVDDWQPKEPRQPGHAGEPAAPLPSAGGSDDVPF